MNTTTIRRPRQPRHRKIGVVERHGPHALLEIVEGTPKRSKAEYYLCDEIPHDWGTAAYRLEKLDGTVYDVLLDEQTERHSCDCLGGIQHGHQTRCKHVAGLLALRQSGKLPGWTPFPRTPAVPVSHPRLQEVGDHYRPGYHDEPIENIFSDI
jgi:hypothetical protein